jgi:ATP-dependent Zn protease
MNIQEAITDAIVAGMNPGQASEALGIREAVIRDRLGLPPARQPPPAREPWLAAISRREVAYHEAAHAVIARMLGLEVRRATMRDAQGHGCAVVTSDGTLNFVMMCLAGRIASYLFLATADEAGCESDNDKADELLAELGFSDPPAMRERLLLDVHALVCEHAGAIERVAKQLLRQGSLTGAEIDQLLAREAARKRRKGNGQWLTTI